MGLSTKKGSKPIGSQGHGRARPWDLLEGTVVITCSQQQLRLLDAACAGCPATSVSLRPAWARPVHLQAATTF
ncbi:hypothetical protein ACH4GP_01110 [Streptomyces celluloflavus]|uniref:Uncharacterized protein n=1 Tax=Streptomyces celluloflavus TaxID=58344 RepID=A0ABW7R4K9_9ACTN